MLILQRVFLFTNVLTFRNITNAMRTFHLSLSDFPKTRYDFFSRHSFVQLLNAVFFLQIHSQLHRFWSKILCIYKRFSLRGHFLLSLPNFFQEEKRVFFPDITLSCSPNCSPQFFYKFIYNCIVF